MKRKLPCMSGMKLLLQAACGRKEERKACANPIPRQSDQTTRRLFGGHRARTGSEEEVKHVDLG